MCEVVEEDTINRTYYREVIISIVRFCYLRKNGIQYGFIETDIFHANYISKSQVNFTFTLIAQWNESLLLPVYSDLE